VPLFAYRQSRRRRRGKGSTRQLSKDRGGVMRGAGNVWGQLGEFVINCGLASPNPPPKFTR